MMIVPRTKASSTNQRSCANRTTTIGQIRYHTRSTAAAPARPRAFLEKVVQRLNGHGDGFVGRVVRETQREFWCAPDLEERPRVGKWGR